MLIKNLSLAEEYLRESGSGLNKAYELLKEFNETKATAKAIKETSEDVILSANVLKTFLDSFGNKN